MSGFDENWSEFEERCRACRECDLCNNRTNVVIYRGSRKAPLMVIGEAPGATEDEQGLPFVGRSGQLLQYLLGTFGLTDKDYHICNICKCRPPENRRPEPSEIKACKKLLGEQFKLVKPKVILLCGSTAYEAFFNSKPVMNQVRGTFIEKNGYDIMTTFHPAYALRNPKMKVPMAEDMQKVYDRLLKYGLVDPVPDINS